MTARFAPGEVQSRIRERGLVLDRRLSAGLITAWVLLLAFAFLYRVKPWPDILLHIDFSSYWTGARLVLEGAGPELYDADRQHAFQLELRRSTATAEEIRTDDAFNPFPNPPPLALLYVPLTLLPISWAYLLWWGISFLSFVAAIALPLRGQALGRTKASLMLSFVAVTHTLFEGQPYGLFALALTLGLLALRNNRPILGGALIGLLWLKPQYAIIFPVIFLLKRRWLELAAMSAVGAFFGLLSLLMIGVEGLFAYKALLAEMSSFHYQWVDPWSMINWRSLIFVISPAISDDFGSSLVLVLGATTIITSLTVWQGEWVPSSAGFGAQVLVAILAIVVAAPHSHILGAVLALPPLAIALGQGPARGLTGAKWVVILMLGYFIGLATWPLGFPRWLFVPYILLLGGSLVAQRSTAERLRSVWQRVEA